eukprot:SAG11_NODE_1122_length_5788_cov_7.564423_2_plen_299_part_00
MWGSMPVVRRFTEIENNTSRQYRESIFARNFRAAYVNSQDFLTAVSVNSQLPGAGERRAAWATASQFFCFGGVVISVAWEGGAAYRESNQLWSNRRGSWHLLSDGLTESVSQQTQMSLWPEPRSDAAVFLDPIRNSAWIYGGEARNSGEAWVSRGQPKPRVYADLWRVQWPEPARFGSGSNVRNTLAGNAANVTCIVGMRHRPNDRNHTTTGGVTRSYPITHAEGGKPDDATAIYGTSLPHARSRAAVWNTQSLADHRAVLVSAVQFGGVGDSEGEEASGSLTLRQDFTIWEEIFATP